MAVWVGQMLVAVGFVVIWSGPDVVVSESDMFTSMMDVQRGLFAQRNMATDLRVYVAKERQRIEALEVIADDLERQSLEALANPEEHLSNPVNAFLLIKRFSIDWNENIRNYVNNNNSDEFLAYLATLRGVLPNQDDLYGSAMALLRLQDVYALSTARMARGIVEDQPKAPVMTADDCFQLGTVAYYKDDHYHAILWMMEALSIDEREIVKTAKRTLILDFLSFSMYRQGNVIHAYNLTLQWLQLEPDHPRALTNLKSYESMISSDEILLLKAQSMDEVQLRNERHRDEYKATDEYRDYERLCRGERTQAPEDPDQLKCYYRRHVPMFYINPLREEVIHLNPRVVVYHEVMTNAEIAKVKEIATPKLHRSGVFQVTENDNPYTDYRTSKSAWLKAEEDPEGLLNSLNRKARALSNLTLDTAEELQVLNYGIGGQYEPHYDFARSTEIYTFEEFRGNRIATVIYYLTDVEMGGGTTFNLIGLHTPAKKGTCVLWYNLMLNGEGDYRTKHAGCPVLIGNKWVCTKWFHVNGQEFTRPCALSPEL